MSHVWHRTVKCQYTNMHICSKFLFKYGITNKVGITMYFVFADPMTRASVVFRDVHWSFLEIYYFLVKKKKKKLNKILCASGLHTPASILKQYIENSFWYKTTEHDLWQQFNHEVALRNPDSQIFIQLLSIRKPHPEMLSHPNYLPHMSCLWVIKTLLKEMVTFILQIRHWPK